MNSFQNSPSERYQMPTKTSMGNPYEQKQPMPVPGDKIGPNIIQTLVGEGGSANVYKVWHEELEMIRAVKILKKSNNKDARERFFTEAKILADIHHPNIVEIHNIGYMNSQLPYLELEFIDGVSIKQAIHQHSRLPLAVALSTAYFVCQALHYAHVKDYTLYRKIYRGLIHRDIKPDNIVLSKDGIIKLMDFGIARPSEVSLHTVGSKIMGTLVYLSPEQLNGQPLDHRSDIFSLGTVLYEMITGKRAFPQKTLSELVQKKTAGHFRPLSSHNIELPDLLVGLVEKAMALSPQDRYNSAAEFGYDIYAVLKHISDLAPQDVLTNFVQNPASIPAWEPPKDLPLEPIGKRLKLLQPWIIAAAAAGAAIAGTLALVFKG
ncbi:MAG: serine/threonine protein kinase [Chitinispirillaceae bacterium]